MEWKIQFNTVHIYSLSLHRHSPFRNSHPPTERGTCVATDEPTLMHCHHPGALVYIGGSLLVVYTLWVYTDA